MRRFRTKFTAPWELTARAARALFDGHRVLMFAAGPTAPSPSKALALARALASRDARRACDRVRNEAKQALRRAAKAEKVAARVDKATDERLCSTCGIRKLPCCFRPDRFVCKDCLGTE